MKKLIKRSPVDALKILKKEFETTYIQMKTGTYKFEEGEKRALIGGSMIPFFAMSTSSAFAATDIVTHITSLLKDWYGSLLAASTIIFVIVEVILFLAVMLADDRETQAIKKKAKTVFWAYIAINFMGGIVRFIQEISEGMQFEV